MVIVTYVNGTAAFVVVTARADGTIVTKEPAFYPPISPAPSSWAGGTRCADAPARPEVGQAGLKTPSIQSGSASSCSRSWRYQACWAALSALAR